MIINIHDLTNGNIVSRHCFGDDWPDGVAQVVSFRSAYLVSAGQSVELGVSVTRREPGSRLIDARAVTMAGKAAKPMVFVPIEHQYCRVPSRRTLSEVLLEAVNHGTAHPNHGTDCICMDDLIREVRAHAFRVIPERYFTSTKDDNWERRIDALSRVGYILHAVVRGL
jgi:hypothetical protein